MNREELVDALKNTINNMSNQTVAAQQDNNFQVQPNTAVIGRGQTPRNLYGMDANISLEPLLDSRIRQAIDEANPTLPQQYEFEDLMQMFQNYNDYQRNENLKKFTQDYNNEQLYGPNYGDAIAEMLQDTPQGQTLLDDVRQKMMMANKPISRERNITGSVPEPDWWTVEGLKDEGPFGYRK